MPQQNGRKSLGQKGEDLACDYLTALGYQIVKRNYRAERGEIDIIAQDHADLVFVEVKTDRSGKFGAPEAWVTRRKQKQIAKVAALFLQELDQQPPPCRFDVITVTFSQGSPKIQHLKEAFYPEEDAYGPASWE